MSQKLRPFSAIYAEAAANKGGEAALEALFMDPKPRDALAAIPDDRWLAGMSKRVFQAGFSWEVVDQKWPRFEEVFQGFDIGRMRMLSDDDIEDALKDKGLIRNARKIQSIRDNAIFLHEFGKEGGGIGPRFADWPSEQFADLLLLIKQGTSQLGLTGAGYFLRFMGRDGFVLSPAVAEALIREGVVEKPPSSRRDLARIQEAFNTWKAESGRPLNHISRTLAASLG